MSSRPADPSFLCLTPTRNENWIIRQFVAAARCWADRVIVADQQSTDGTWEFLAAQSDVAVIVNDSPQYDENHRQRLLLGRARQIAGRRILIGLDADEALSSNCVLTRDWKRIRAAEPGTILRFRWVNLLPGFERAWILPDPVPFGFVDDGSDHTGTKIHSARVPQPRHAPTLDLEEIVVLHFQYVAWDRMLSKQRWYQAWEHAHHRRKGALEIFRQYHHMHGGWPDRELLPVRPEWLAGYEQGGIDFRAVRSEPITWWDRELVRMLNDHGAGHFRRIAIWNRDWNDVARQVGLVSVDLRDPRTPLEKIAHRLLAATQRHRANWGVRGFERMLRIAGW